MTKKLFIPIIAFACWITIQVTAQQTATEAPTGFTTPTVTQNPGSQSTSNGIPAPAGDTFAFDQAQFERVYDPSTGLGPLRLALSATRTGSLAQRARLPKCAWDTWMKMKIS